jgi:hypothetical protein
VLIWQEDRARVAGLEKWALANDWRFVRHPAVDWPGRVREHSTDRLKFALYGLVDGRAVAIAECDFSSASNTSEPRTDPVVLLMAELRQPAQTVAVHRRTAWEQSDRRRALDRPTFVGVEAFDHEYRIVAPDPRAARAVVGPALIAEHVAGTLPDWSVQGREVLTCRPGQIGVFIGIPGQFTSVMRVADLIEADAAEPPRD